MKEILIFAGTTEGRKLSECLSAAGISHTVCVATEYGEIVLNEHPLAKVHCGRMDIGEIREYIKNERFAAIVDATHPYAELITENIQGAIEGMDIPYLRLKRDTEDESTYEKITYFESNEDCAKALEHVEGNILLTTGSKELAVYCSNEEVKQRLYVRILPGMESLKLCMEQGIMGKQILALQGPFTTGMNEAMICQYQIGCLVTKKSGRTGGYQEKIDAARRQNIPVFVVGQSKQQKGYSFAEVCQKLEMICGQKILPKDKMEIILAGVGMGSRECLTREVCKAIEDADILFGAERMISPYQPKLEKQPFYMASQIIPYLKELQGRAFITERRKVVVLFSGDSGFYSGCQSLYKALQDEIEKDRLNASVCILPGISSIAYLAACIGESYQDADICSMHGKKLINLTKRIKRGEKIFLIMSGVKDVNRLGTLLVDGGLHNCEIFVGYQLSYPEQKIMKMTPKECVGLTEEGLYCCCIKNPDAVKRKLTHGKSDTAFIRGKVPMTKEEVREVSICKIQLHQEAVVYDIGSGTGSIAVEIAGLSDDLKVFAIEKKEEAAALIKQNKAKFHLENIEVAETSAPEGLVELPAPTHAFIGGSGGELKEILSLLYQKNPEMRVVINAISLETICEIKEILSMYPIKNEDIVQMQVSRTRIVGNYHLMQSENLVWICAFNFCRQKGENDET